jgi:hypothetical protein
MQGVLKGDSAKWGKITKMLECYRTFAKTAGFKTIAANQ